jgi:hypothetical protein
MSPHIQADVPNEQELSYRDTENCGLKVSYILVKPKAVDLTGLINTLGYWSPCDALDATIVQTIYVGYLNTPAQESVPFPRRSCFTEERTIIPSSIDQDNCHGFGGEMLLFCLAVFTWAYLLEGKGIKAYVSKNVYMIHGLLKI